MKSVADAAARSRQECDAEPKRQQMENISDNNECHNRNRSEASELLVLSWGSEIKHALYQYKDI